MHSDELRALEQSFQDQLSALQLRVTSLEYRLHPASLRAAGSDSGSNLSVVVGESLEDLVSAEPSLLPLLWETLTVADRLSLRRLLGTFARVLRENCWAQRLSTDGRRHRSLHKPQPSQRPSIG